MRKELHDKLLSELLQWHDVHSAKRVIEPCMQQDVPEYKSTNKLKCVLEAFEQKLQQAQSHPDKNHEEYHWPTASQLQLIHNYVYQPTACYPHDSPPQTAECTPTPQLSQHQSPKSFNSESHQSSQPSNPPPPPPPPKYPQVSQQTPFQPPSQSQQIFQPQPLELSQPQHSQLSQHSTVTHTSRPRSESLILRHKGYLHPNKPFKLVGRQQLRQWKELQQLRKWHHLHLLKEPPDSMQPNPPPTSTSSPAHIGQSIPQLTQQLHEIDQEMYLQIKTFLQQPTSRPVQEKIWHQIQQLQQILMQSNILDQTNSSHGIPVLSGAWFLAMLATLEQKLTQYSEEIDGGLRQVQIDVREAQQRRSEYEVNAPIDSSIGFAKEIDKVHQMVKELDLKYKTLDDKIKLGGIKGAESDKVTSYEELLALIREKQQIIFSENATKSEMEDANIQLEKLMLDYEKCPEVIAEKEAKRILNEKLNLSALENVKPALDAMSAEHREQLVKDKKVLKLMFMSKNAILKMHQNDFASLAFQGLTLEELRALRAWVPTFRKDQPSQAGWQQGLEARIDQMTKETSSSSTPPPPPPLSPPASFAISPPPHPRIIVPSKNRKSFTSSTKEAKPTDLFAELLARTKKMDND